MTIGTVKRLAADIFNVGLNKVRINPDGLKEAEGALTRADVRGLIEKGIITRAKNQGRASTGRTGRRGHGHRKGHPLDQKEVWMEKVRAQRKFLSLLISTKALKAKDKREIYKKVKSGIFRNKKAMLLYLKDNKMVAADYEPPKAEFRKKEHKAPAKKAGHEAGPKHEEKAHTGHKPEPHKAEHKAPEHQAGEHKAEHKPEHRKGEHK